MRRTLKSFARSRLKLAKLLMNKVSWKMFLIWTSFSCYQSYSRTKPAEKCFWIFILDLNFSIILSKLLMNNVSWKMFLNFYFGFELQYHFIRVTHKRSQLKNVFEFLYDTSLDLNFFIKLSKLLMNKVSWKMFLNFYFVFELLYQFIKVTHEQSQLKNNTVENA